MDMYYSSCKKTQTIKIWLIYYAIGGNITERKKLRPISHEKNNHLGKSSVTMKYLMVKFDEKLSWVMLYMNNAPSQVVKPVKPISKQNNQY